MVQDKLKENAKIDAIFFIWSPTASMRLRFEHLIENLKNTLGENAIDSIIFLVNKVTCQWSKDHYDSFLELKEMLKRYNIKNPCLIMDFKQIDANNINSLKEEARKVLPYEKSNFDDHRMKIYYKKFLDIQKIDEETKKKNEEIEKKKKLELELEKLKREDEQKKREMEQICRDNEERIAREEQQKK